MKKILSMIICVMMLAAAVPFSAANLVKADDTGIVLTVYYQEYNNTGVIGEPAVLKTYTMEELEAAAESYSSGTFIGTFNGWTLQKSSSFISLENLMYDAGCDHVMNEPETSLVAVGASDGAWGVKGGNDFKFNSALSFEELHTRYNYFYPDAIAVKVNSGETEQDDKQLRAGNQSPEDMPVSIMLKYGGATLNEGESIADAVYNDESSTGCPRVGLGTGLEENGIITTARGFMSWSNVTEIDVFYRTEDVEAVNVTSVNIDKTEAVLKPGEKLQLSAAILPENATNKNVDWGTSSNMVARVNKNGLVTAIGEGTAYIRAIAADGSKVTGECKVTVRKEEETSSSEEETTSAEETATSTEEPTTVAADDQKEKPSDQADELATPEKEPAIQPAAQGTMFTDVADGSNIYKPIAWAVSAGIVRGYSDNTFKPENSCTREQFAIMMWRFADQPDADINVANRFTDIDDFSNNTSKRAVAWAAGEGIINGFNDGHFGPQETVTRRQVVVMLWRWAGKPSAEQETSFSDISSSESTYKAVQWGAEAGLVKGYSDGSFKPEDPCQRQHIVIFLYRYAREVMGTL